MDHSFYLSELGQLSTSTPNYDWQMNFSQSAPAYRHTSLDIPSGKLQALVYDILPSTTAVFSYVIGSWKLSANEQFFIGAQSVLSLL